MSISHYIKEIGRGKEGARSLTQPQAYDLMSQVLDGRVTDLEVGAFALAMRIKGETTDELAGFLEAANERCMPVRPTKPAVLLASYNGARKLPNLTPLLALLLAQEGVPVLVHGPAHDPGRITTASIFHDLGLPLARESGDVEAAWSRHEPAFMRVEQLSPPLAKLLDVRWTVGLRNPGHTVAKLLDPCRSAGGHPLPTLRLVNYTHPEYGSAHQEFLAHTRANAMLLRGTEGEPVADPRRSPKLEVCIGGQWRDDLSMPAHEGVLTELPVLPRENDAATTAHYIQSVISGEKPAPAPLLRQVECILQALRALPEAQGGMHERTA
jgi:anthranilate phosphoribosyltransferase